MFSYMERNETKQILDGTYLDSQAGHWFIPLLQDSFFYKDDSFAERMKAADFERRNPQK